MRFSLEKTIIFNMSQLKAGSSGPPLLC